MKLPVPNIPGHEGENNPGKKQPPPPKKKKKKKTHTISQMPIDNNQKEKLEPSRHFHCHQSSGDKKKEKRKGESWRNLHSYIWWMCHLHCYYGSIGELLNRHGNCLKGKILKINGVLGPASPLPPPQLNFYPQEIKICPIWGYPRVIFMEIKIIVTSWNCMSMCSFFTSSQTSIYSSTNLLLP